MKLVPCLGCKRHVRIEEEACPFCGGSLPRESSGSSAPFSSTNAGRLSRAALFALGTSTVAVASLAGCDDDKKDDGSQVVAVYGGPPVEAGADGGTDSGANQAVYGGPAPLDGGQD